MASTKTTNAVISYLLEYGSSPRIDIAKALSLTKASVTLVTNEMIDKGIIIEQGELFEEHAKTVRGRRKIMLSINPDYKVTIGGVVTKDKIIIGITNLNGDIFVKNSIPFTFNSQNELCQKIIHEVNILLENNLIETNSVLACGIVITNSILNKLDGETEQAKIDNLTYCMSYSAPYTVTSDTMAKSALISQRVFGKKMNHESCVMISLVESVEIGLCINSSLHAGKHNCAGGRNIINKALSKYQTDNDLESFANTLSLCLSVLDVHYIYGLGGIFNNDLVLNKINSFLAQDMKIQEPVIQENSLFVAGCGLALYRCLIS